MDTIKINDQKDVTLGVLKKIFLMDPFAILAGGAPGDWDRDMPARDLDIFMYANPKIGQGVFTEMLSWALRAYIKRISSKDIDDEYIDESQYKMNPELHDVYETHINGMKVQIMRMDSSTFSSVIPNFPLSVNGAWWKSENIYGCTSDYKLGKKHKILFKVHAGYRDVDRYINKIIAKYPEYDYYGSREEALEAIAWRN